jgi:Ca2+-binding RTX toxin-like protein
MNTVSEQQNLNDDGTPRRKYEIEEQEESRYLFSSTVGLVLASIIIYFKNLLFGEERADPHIARSSGSSTVGGDVNAGDDALEDVTPDKAEKELFDDDSDDPSEEIPDFVRLLFTTTSASYVAGTPFTPFKSFVPANDNIRFHDAVLGSPVMTFPGGGLGNPRPPTGGKASGGGNYDGDYDGDDDEVEEEEEDEDPRPANRLPVVTGPVYLGSFFMNQAVIIALADLLRNVSDPDGDTLSVRELHTSSGNLSVRYDGSWAFSPDVDDTTDVTFTYTISDGKGGTAQTASLDLVPTHDRPIEGTDGDDSIVGTPRDDVIDAGGGDDTIIGREGNDVIYGGDGNDRIVAGDGDDVVYGGGGDDVIFAGAGRDTVFAGIGNDIVFGEEGDDALFGEAGNDTVSGDAGDDTIAGGEGDDTLAGGAANDLIDGGAGIDNIDGGEGQDTILAAAGDDTASGGAGDDLFIAVAGDGNDAYDGGEGTDTYDISATSADAIIDLRAGAASSDEIGDDVIDNIENVRGGSGNDIIFASESVNIFVGGDGNDTFLFGTVAAAGRGHGLRDRILDFAVGDRIDLDDISAEFAEAVDATFDDQHIRRFVLIREQDNFSRPGEIKFGYDTFDGSPVTIIQGNIDYDEDAEFELELAGLYELRDEDFHSHG